MNILFASSEATPFAQSGGLGEVAGALPKALVEKGEDVRVVLPLYECVGEDKRKDMQFLFLWAFADRTVFVNDFHRLSS